jgi:hypothetical protein
MSAPAEADSQGSARPDSAMKRVGLASRWVSVVCMALI